MSQPPGRKMFRSPFQLGSQMPYPGGSDFEAQPTQKQPSAANTRTNQGPPSLPMRNQPPAGTFNSGQPPFFSDPTLVQTLPVPSLSHPSQQFPLSQSRYMSGTSFAGMSGGELSKNQKKKNMLVRARNKYRQLSIPAKVACMLLAFLIAVPLLAGVVEAANGITMYQQAEGGMNHLHAAANVFQGGTKGDYSKYFVVAKLHQAQSEVNAAHGDFVALSDELDHDRRWPLQARYCQHR